MKSSSTAKKFPAETKPLQILLAVKEFITSLSPPVFSFEKNIRATPFKILISVLLSSRTKDPVSEKAAARLFAKADSPIKMLALSTTEISRLIYPVGFFRKKAENILKISRILTLNKKFPQTLEDLLNLPGIGRKSANLVLSLAFNVPAIAVDTHVFRISRRLHWVQGRTTTAVEAELQRIFPRSSWPQINQVLVGFGQTICRPISPKCAECVLKIECPSAETSKKRA